MRQELEIPTEIFLLVKGQTKLRSRDSREGNALSNLLHAVVVGLGNAASSRSHQSGLQERPQDLSDPVNRFIDVFIACGESEAETN